MHISYINVYIYIWDPHIYSIGRNTKRYKVHPKKTVEEIHDYVHHLKLRQEQRGKLQKAGFDPEAFGQLQHSLRQVEAWGFLDGDLGQFLKKNENINCNWLGLPHILQFQMRNMMMNHFDLRLYHGDHVEKYWRRCFHIAIFDYRGRICRPL